MAKKQAVVSHLLGCNSTLRGRRLTVWPSWLSGLPCSLASDQGGGVKISQKRVNLEVSNSSGGASSRHSASSRHAQPALAIERSIAFSRGCDCSLVGRRIFWLINFWAFLSWAECRKSFSSVIASRSHERLTPSRYGCCMRMGVAGCEVRAAMWFVIHPPGVRSWVIAAIVA